MVDFLVIDFNHEAFLICELAVRDLVKPLSFRVVLVGIELSTIWFLLRYSCQHTAKTNRVAKFCHSQAQGHITFPKEHPI